VKIFVSVRWANETNYLKINNIPYYGIFGFFGVFLVVFGLSAKSVVVDYQGFMNLRFSGVLAATNRERY